MKKQNNININPENPGFRFIDLFAGIGGIRLAFQYAGGECVFSSEYDRFAQETYRAFFGESPIFKEITEEYQLDINPPGDITQLQPDLIPDHDILTGGFPCQPFSLAGVSKKKSLGKKHGFDDPTQGTLFFNIKEIINAKRPKAFLLENVKHLRGHDQGRTYEVITKTLRDELGYHTFDEIIDASGWVPQHRERIYMVGFRPDDGDQEWEITEFKELGEIKPSRSRKPLVKILEDSVPDRYTLGPNTWNTLERHKKYHESKGHGFGYGLIEPPFDERVTRTMSARYHKDGAEILIAQKGKRPRRLTPLECLRLMGFPEEYEKYFERNNGVEQPVSDTQAYRQFGNSVAVPVVSAIAEAMVKKMREAGAL